MPSSAMDIRMPYVLQSFLRRFQRLTSALSLMTGGAVPVPPPRMTVQRWTDWGSVWNPFPPLLLDHLLLMLPPAPAAPPTDTTARSLTCRSCVPVIVPSQAFQITCKELHVECRMHRHACTQSETTPGRFLSGSLLQVIFLCICGLGIFILSVHRPPAPRARYTSHRCIRIAQNYSQNCLDARMSIDITDIHHH